ncbi:MAG: hypothetical protein Q8K58_09355 [Acidimicrobiales bacterium]|nr:hypothetical protein [Acidimicrobiales bacterium]
MARSDPNPAHEPEREGPPADLAPAAGAPLPPPPPPPPPAEIAKPPQGDAPREPAFPGAKAPGAATPSADPPERGPAPRTVAPAVREGLANALGAMEDQTLAVQELVRELARAEASRAADLGERLTAQYNLTSGMARHLTGLHTATGEQLEKLAGAIPPDVTALVQALGRMLTEELERTRTQFEATNPDLLRRLGEVVEVTNARHDELAVLLAKSIATDPTPKLVEIAELMINQHRQMGSRLSDLAGRLPPDPTAHIQMLIDQLPPDPQPQLTELARVAERLSVRQTDADQRLAAVAQHTERLSVAMEEVRSVLRDLAASSTRQVEEVRELWGTPLKVDTSELEAGQARVGAAHADDIAELRRDMGVLLQALRQRDDDLTQLHRDVAWLVRQLEGA